MRIKLFAAAALLLISVSGALGAPTMWFQETPYGLTDVGAYSSPDIYNDGGTLKLISGDSAGTFTGWYLSGGVWVPDANVVTGLTDVGAYSSPDIYNDGGTLKLISGDSAGTFTGWYLSGGVWVPDANVVTGLTDVGTESSPDIYNDGGTLKLISGKIDGTFTGWYLSGGVWVPNANVVTGLTDVGAASSPDIHDDEGTLKLISGDSAGTFTGWYLSGGVWVPDANVVTGLTDVGVYSPPAVYNDGGALKLISGDSAGTFTGWYLYDFAPSASIATYEINGIVHDVINETTVNQSTVKLTQSGNDYTETTDADGIYNLTNFVAGYQTTFNVTKTNYTHEDWSWTAWEGKTYSIDLYVIPTNVTFNGSAAIHGIVTYDPYHKVLNNATVTVSNATWSNTTQTTSYGYYFFENLTVSNYNISASKTGYSTSTNATVAANSTTLHNVNLEPKLTLTVIAKNADTLNLITDYSIILNGTTYNSLNGSLSIGNLKYGVKDLILTADGYYATEKVVYIDDDTTTTILATQILGSGNYYAPHYVKFTIKSLLGTKYNDINVVVYLGGNASGTLTLNGTTGTDGAVGFMLVENLEYTLTFINTTQGIDETITLYPVDNEYTVYTCIGNLIDDLLNPDDEEQAITAIDVSVTKAIINDNTANITVNYNDIMDETSGLTLVLSQSIAGNTTNRTILSTVDLGTTNNTAYNFTVTNYNGQSYFIEVTATHATHGAIYRMYGIQFENTDTLFGFTGEVVGWLAIVFLTWFALTATSATVPQTAIGVCALATAMMAIGWGSYISVPGLGLAWIMALAANMAHAKEASA